MPTYRNCFSAPSFCDHEIMDDKGKKLGTIRVKPSGILWKPAHAREYFSVNLERFTEWIKSPESGARRTKS